MKKILVLFPNEWDRSEFGGVQYKGKYHFVYHGDNLFRFPGSLRLLCFDPMKFIEQTVRRFERNKIDGVLSTDEYIGAVTAAAVAKRLGLPGADPEKLLLAQHKFLSRQLQSRIAPGATPAFMLLPLKSHRHLDGDLEFPVFVKPVKGTYSIFAARANTPEALRRHIDFTLLERFCLKRLIGPFNKLLRGFTDSAYDASYFIGEELLEGVQVTVDGFACGGDVRIMGVVDSVMFPGTHTFKRFEYPSSLSSEVQKRMGILTKHLIRGMGMNYGQFNVELFYDARTDAIKIIEINPRLSYQFADLYEKVDGCNTYDILLDLTLGKKPAVRRACGRFTCAASFVFRTFEGERLEQVPSPNQIETFGRRHRGSRIKIYGRPGQSLFSEMRAVGSYRYAIVNMGAPSPHELLAIYQEALERLEFKIA